VAIPITSAMDVLRFDGFRIMAVLLLAQSTDST
jgi:hypothetical protein